MNKSTRIGSALAVVGSSIAAAPASALELGELKVHSTLGQPLRASVAYALGPNEAVESTCVSVQRAHGGPVPSAGKGSISIANGVIAISGTAPVREPVVSIRVSIRCPYTPRLTREYTLFVDPLEVAPSPVEAPVPERLASGPVLIAPPVARTGPAPRAVSREPISASSYLVQIGDSLSLIAQRVENATGDWRDMSAAIFAANPDAFMNNDPNQLKAGSTLSIPSDTSAFAAGPAVVEPVAIDPVDTPVSAPFESTVYETGMASEAVETPEPVVEMLEEIPEPVDMEPVNELRPGDLIVDSTVSIPDTQVDAAPEITSESPNGSIAIIRTPVRQESQGPNWLMWAGGGIASLFALFFLGRFARDRFGSTPIAPAAEKPKPAEEPTRRVEAIADVDLDLGPAIDDDSPTAENLQLDADLVVGTGLSDTADVDVASDFAFAATTELDVDIELTPEMTEQADEDPETDIIPPLNADESSILKSEVLPEEDEDDEYDMSVIVDATKMPDPSDVTERDLEAIAVDEGDDTLIPGDYTISKDVDYKVLEQDYEDEFTATQALNEEIQKAAEDLATGVYGADKTISDTGINAGSVNDLDVTAQMPANDDENLDDQDDTSVNPTINTDDIEGDTVEMPTKDKKAG